MEKVKNLKYTGKHKLQQWKQLQNQETSGVQLVLCQQDAARDALPT